MESRERRSSIRKRSTSVEFDINLLAAALKGRDRQVFLQHHPRLTSAVSHIEHGGGFDNYENDDIEVDHSSDGIDVTIPTDFRLHERVFIRKIDKLISPVAAVKRRWEPFEELSESICHAAPLERYMTCSTQRLIQKFVNDLTVGDILIGEIQAWRRNQVDLVFVAMDGGQARHIPLNINILCEIPQKDEEVLEEGDLVRCVVTAVHNDRIFATADPQKLQSIDPILSLKVKLGGIDRKDLPVYHHKIAEVEEYSCLTDDIDKSDPFKNPSCAHYLLDRLGVDVTEPLSLLNVLTKPDKAECKEALRRQQSSQAAVKYVAKGVEQFKKGEFQEAMNMYRTALDLDASNVDALVARGALYCSRKQWIPACTDLEKAYGIDQTHKNAKTYLIETLFQRANAISFEAKNKIDLEKAQKCLERMLDLDPHHEGANKKLKIMRKPSVFSSIGEQLKERLKPPSPKLDPVEQKPADKESSIDKEIARLMKKRERKKRKSEKKRKRDRSRSRSRSPRDRIKYHQRSKERRQSSSSNNSVILIDERSSSRERERSRRISGSKPDMRLYQPPLLPRNTTITINPQKLDALTKKTSDIKGNLSDILGMLDKK